MKNQTLIAFLVCSVSLTAFPEEGFHQYAVTGAYDCPKIPGSEYTVHQLDRPQPPRVVPDGPVTTPPPSDAIVLFDGTGTDQFKANEWLIQDGALIATQGGLITRRSFGDLQLHVEWRVPNPPNPGIIMSMGNSGVKLMGKYELQVFDSYSCKIYADGSAAAIYGQSPPLANACLKPGEWQSYDVMFTAPVYEEGQLVKAGRRTVLHNGVLVQNDTEILGTTMHKKAPGNWAHAAKLPIVFQAHKSPVAYRNMWVRELVSPGL